MVIRDARLATCCGHHYCESCLRVWLNSRAQKLCPQCRQINFQNVINLEKIRDINQLRVRCTNKEKGCKWVGELGALKHHLESDNGCDYVMVTCSNTGYEVMQMRSPLTTCGAAMERRHLTYHHKYQCLYRQYTCQYCGYIDTYDAIAGSGEIRNRGSRIVGEGNHYSQYRGEIRNRGSRIVGEWNHYSQYRGEIRNRGSRIRRGRNHYSQCYEYPLKCPNECGTENIKRKDMKIHRETCPLEPLDCPFQHVGCFAGKILRKDMDTHCQKMTQGHLVLMVRSHQDLAQKNKELGRNHEELSHKVDQLTKKVEVMKKK